MLVLLVNIL